MIRDAFTHTNLQSYDSQPDWKVQRFPFVASDDETLANMKPGYLLKFDNTGMAVVPALAADDAVLAGVLIDLAADPANPNDTTVAVAMSGSFNINQIHYADDFENPGVPLSVAAIERLRSLQIYLDPAVPAGPSSP